MGNLDALEAITAFSLFADDVKDGVDQISTFSVETLGPVVTSTSLAEDEVVGVEEPAVRTSTDGVYCARLKVHKDGTGDIMATAGFIVIDIDSLKLEVGVTMVSTSWVNAVLVRDDLPELGTDLVSTLAALDVNDFSHTI